MNNTKERMNDLIGLILMAGALLITALYSWWGIVMLLVGAYIVLSNGDLVHFSGGIHRPFWTDWFKTQDFGTIAPGFSAGTVVCEERICEKCRVIQRRNWKRD